VRNSCKFEKLDLVESSDGGETYEARIACDNSGEWTDDPREADDLEYVDLIIQRVACDNSGENGDLVIRHGDGECLIISNPPEG
jgi:hypothetical protein